MERYLGVLTGRILILPLPEMKWIPKSHLVQDRLMFGRFAITPTQHRVLTEFTSKNLIKLRETVNSQILQKSSTLLELGKSIPVI